MITEAATKPCAQCKAEYSQSFIGSSCPFCEVVNWKYQELVIPLGVAIGVITMLLSIYSVFTQI
jgi:hypothetical protein